VASYLFDPREKKIQRHKKHQNRFEKFHLHPPSDPHHLSDYPHGLNDARNRFDAIRTFCVE
jgi:hypothetical protein